MFKNGPRISCNTKFLYTPHYIHLMSFNLFFAIYVKQLFLERAIDVPYPIQFSGSLLKFYLIKWMPIQFFYMAPLFSVFCSLALYSLLTGVI